MESGCTFPCPFCEGQKVTWAGKNVLRSNKGINALAEMYAAPEEEGGGGGIRANGKNFKCCVSSPLIGDATDDTPVLLVFVPPALHLKLGINKLLQLLKLFWPGLVDWMLSKLHIDIKDYQGKQGNVEGRGADTFLNNIEELEKVIPAEWELFIPCFKAFRAVIKACFGCYTLEEDYKVKIAEFKTSQDELYAEIDRITSGWTPKEKPPAHVTTKFHIMDEHIITFCDHFGLPLGAFSEQGLERIHATFARLWEVRFAVNNVENPNYGPELLKCGLLLNYEQVMCLG